MNPNNNNSSNSGSTNTSINKNHGATLPIIRTLSQIGSARFKSQPDLHNINNEIDPSLIWRTSEGQQRTEALWKEIQNSLNQPEICNENVIKFVLLYSPQYDKWNKELQPDVVEMKLIGIKNKCTPVLDKQTTKYLVGQLMTFILNLSNALTDKIPKIPDGLHFICLVNILSRNPQNHIPLQEVALSHTFQVARLASYKLTTLDRTSETFSTWFPYLQILLGYFCNITINFAFDKTGWQLNVKHSSQVNNWDHIYLDSSALSNSSSSLTSLLQPFQQQSGSQSLPTTPSSSFHSLPTSPSHHNTSGSGSGSSNTHHSGGYGSGSSNIFLIGSPNGGSSLSLSQSTGSISPDKGYFNTLSSHHHHNYHATPPTSPGPSTSSTPGTISLSQPTQQIFKLGIISILLDSLEFFNNNYTSKQPKDAAHSFRYLLADTMGAVIYSCFNVKLNDTESKRKMKIITQCLGRKSYISSKKKHSSLQSEFNFQLHILRIIKELVNNNTANARDFIESNGFSKIEEFVLWSTECFQPSDQHLNTNELSSNIDVTVPLSETAALSLQAYETLNSVLSSLKFTTFSTEQGSSVKYPQPVKRSRITQLTQLFQVLHTFTYSSLSFSKLSINSQQSSGSSMNYQQQQHSSSNYNSSMSLSLPLSLLQQQHDESMNHDIINDYIPNENDDNNNNENTEFSSSNTTSSGANNSSPTSSAVSIVSLSTWSINASSNSNSWSSFPGGGGGGGGSSSNLINSSNNNFVEVNSYLNNNNNNNNNSSSNNNGGGGGSTNYSSFNISNSNSQSSANLHSTGLVNSNKKYINNLIIEMLLERLFTSMPTLSLPGMNHSTENLEHTLQAKDNILMLIKTKYPELQLMILEYLCKIVTENSKSLPVLRKYFLYNLLIFSEYFYNANNNNNNNITNSTTNNIELKRQMYLFQSLRQSTLKAIQYFATINQGDNFEEIMVLIDYLKHRGLGQPTQIIEICQILMNITKLNSSNTIKTMIRIKIFQQLSQIIHSLLAIHNQLESSSQPSPLLKKSRNILYCYLGQLINNEELSCHAVQDRDLIETLFLLLKKPETKVYAQTQIFFLMKLNTEQIGLDSILSEIYNTYISQFTKIRDETPSIDFGFELILTLLDGIRTIVKANPKKQLLFNEYDVFLNIFTVVNADYPKEKLSVLCHSVLKTIIILLVNNPKIKVLFKERIGYDSVKDVILKAEGIITETTMNLIFDMIVDDEFDKEYNYIIQNSDAVLLLFNLLGNFPIHLQHKILDTFTPSVQKCTTNQSVCCNCHLIYQLLDAIHKDQPMEITTKILYLIEQLGYHSVTVRELKKLFGLLKSEQGEIRPQLTSNCLSTLSNISVSGNPGPKVYFDFDGKDSYIQLPTFDKWPFPKGFSFCTWVRIESFIDPTGTPEYRPRLFSFLSDSGCGIEVLFIYQNIQVNTVCNGVSKSIFGPTTNPPFFDEKKWYFLCIVYSTNIISSNEIRIYIDGQLRIKAPIKLSFQSSLMNNFKIGSNSSKISGDRCNPLYGQMGAFNIFDDSLSQNQIQGIFSMGPNFNTTFQDSDGTSAKNSSSHSFDSSLTNHLFLNYNCRAIEGDLCLDNTPDIGGDRNYDATLVSINPCVSRDIKDIIYCLGGIKVLFPLIHQISNMSLTHNNSGISSSKLTIQVLALFKDMLFGSDANQEEMLRCFGFKVMGYLLQQIQPENLTNGALNIIKDMSTQISDPALVEEVYIYLLLDFRIWIKTKYEVQKTLFNMIKQIIYDKYDQVKDIITVQRILDIMNDFYWYEIPRPSQQHQPPPSSSDPQDTFSETSSVVFQSRDIIQRRPQISDITDLRKTVIFEILRHLLRNATNSDVSAISRFLVYSLDSRQLIEMMQFILELLTAYENNNSSFQSFYDEFLNHGGTDILLTLLRNVDENVRMSALQLIIKIHHLYSLSNNKQRKSKIFQDSIIIVRSLQLFPLSDITYGYLLGFTLGFNFTPLTFNTHPTLDHYNGDGFTEIKNPDILGVTLQLLVFADIVLRQHILQELKLLIINSPHNRSSWIQIDKWSDHLFSIINDTEIKNDTQYSNVTDLIIEIMKILSIHSFHEIKPGYKTLEQILATLRPYGDRGVLDYHSLTRTLLLNIVTTIKSEANTLTGHSSESPLNSHSKKSKKSLDIFNDNLIHFLILTEEFIFYSPKDDVQSMANSFLPIDNDNGNPNQLTPPSPNNNTLSNPLLVGSLPCHNSSLISFFSRLHIGQTSNNNNSNSDVWEDFELVKELLELSDILKLVGHSNEIFATSNMQPVTGNLKSTIIFSNHHHRILLRLTLEIVKELSKRNEPSIPLVMLHVQRIKYILAKDLTSKAEESNQRCIFTLSHILKAFKSMSDLQSKLSQSLIPFIKELLSKLKSLVIENLIQRRNMTDPNGSSLSPSNITNPQDQEISEWVAKMADAARAVDFPSTIVKSPRWNYVCEYIEIQSQSLFFNEEKLLVTLVEKRKKKSNKAVQNLDDKEAESFTLAERKADYDLKLVQVNLFAPEVERRSLLLRSSKEQMLETTSSWRKILRSLTNERGPWGTLENSSNLHWKLDKTESYSRMRFKLKRNYKFDEHLNCAINDDMTENNNNNALLDRDHSRNSNSEGDGVKILPIQQQLQNTIDEESEFVIVNSDELDSEYQQQQLQQQQQQKEKLLYSTTCEWISPMNSKKGKFEITSSHIIFTEEQQNLTILLDQSVQNLDEPLKYKRWPIDMIKETHLRRYLLRPSAIEIFMKDKTNYFFNFQNNDRKQVRRFIKTTDPSETLKKAMSDWEKRKITNFDYLMILNTAAGRTFNDLTQYPVFPWVIADYTSTTLDFSKPETFRDLSKPIGALNEKRLEIFKDRYESFDDPVIPKFHYGSHYSSAGIVLYYLIRLEPYTTQFLQLQGGRFDHADRMFDSIELAWHNSLTSSTDVKELIPEFFYQPEFLTNHNNFNFGVKQNGVPIGDIQLPPWASSPHEFIRLNREALESDYVSAHLMEWIDLIFGVKQKGKAAEDNYNVFYYLTYEGSVNIDSIVDETTRKATEAQINNFGQTPTQLFPKKPHAPRDPLHESQLTIPKTLHAHLQAFLVLKSPSKYPIVYIFIPEPNVALSYLVSDKISIIDKSRTTSSHKWFPNTPNEKQSPFTFELDSSSNTKRRIGLPFANDVTISQNCFAITNDGKYVISCGHWDNSFKLSYVDSAKLIQSVTKHKDSVTCLALASDDQILVTGSKDTTVMVWKISGQHKNGTPRFDDVPSHILYGHDDEITCVDINVELDISISGSKDGTCIIHNVRHGEYVRSIYLPKPSPISLVSISNQGYIVIYSQSDLMIYLYSINGKLLNSIETHDRLYSMIVTKDSEYLITGGEKGNVVIRSLYNLKNTNHKLEFKSPVHSLTMSHDQRHLIAGLSDGRLLIICKSTVTSK